MKKVLKTSSDFFCYFKASDSYCVRFKGAKRNEQTGISWLVYLSNSFHYPQPQPRINSMHQGNELFWVQLANPVTQCHRHWWWHWWSSKHSTQTFTWMPTKVLRANSMLVSIKKSWGIFPIKQKFDTMITFIDSENC